MTNFQSKLRSVIAAFLSLIVFAAITAGVYLDLDHAIKTGSQDQLQHRLILLTVLMSLPGVIIAFLLGFTVRVATNPKTRWLIPSILVGAGVGITFRAVANKVQTEAQKPRIRVPLAAGKAEPRPLPPPKGAIPLDEPKAPRLKDFVPAATPNDSGSKEFKADLAKGIGDSLLGAAHEVWKDFTGGPEYASSKVAGRRTIREELDKHN
jgi:hypothetical protein